MTNVPRTTIRKAQALEIAASLIERIEASRLTQVPLLHLDELPAIAGLYFATTDDGDILYIGKADDLTQRCKLSQHHKLPLAIERGATVLQIARVDDGLAWAVEQKLIAEIAPPLNDAVSLWWVQPAKVAKPKKKKIGYPFIPRNGATRLSKQVWIEAKALRRYSGLGSIRKAIEKIIDDAVTQRLADPDFVKVVQEVKAEGVEK